MTDTAAASQLTHRDEEVIQRLTDRRAAHHQVVMDLCATAGESFHNGGGPNIDEEEPAQSPAPG